MSCACGQIWRSCRSGRSGRATSVGVSESVDPYRENYGYITCYCQLYPKTPQGKNHVNTGSYDFISQRLRTPVLLTIHIPVVMKGPGDHQVVLKQPRLVTTGDPFFFQKAPFYGDLKIWDLSISHMLRVWYIYRHIYLHLGDFGGKCC